MRQDNRAREMGHGSEVLSRESDTYLAPKVRLYTEEDLSQPALRIQGGTNVLSEEEELYEDPYGL